VSRAIIELMSRCRYLGSGCGKPAKVFLEPSSWGSVEVMGSVTGASVIDQRFIGAGLGILALVVLVVILYRLRHAVRPNSVPASRITSRM
jgi:hypothetical protein